LAEKNFKRTKHNIVNINILNDTSLTSFLSIFAGIEQVAFKIDEFWAKLSLLVLHGGGLESLETYGVYSLETQGVLKVSNF